MHTEAFQKDYEHLQVLKKLLVPSSCFSPRSPLKQPFELQNAAQQHKACSQYRAYMLE